VKELKVRLPAGAPAEDGFRRERVWARASAMAAAEELRASGGTLDDSTPGDDVAWLRRQLGTLGRRS
jgi:hypothetical protein